MINRRELLNIAAAVGAASVLATQRTESTQAGEPTIKIIDTNVSLFQWPFRRLPLDEPAALVNKFRSLGIVQAWAGSFEGLLHRDIAGVNTRLANACQRFPDLIPIGSINLDLPDWENDLRRCIHEHHMPGLRVHPNYHGYTLDDPRFARLLQFAATARRFVQIAAAMEDTRTQHPLVRVPDVDLSPLAKIMERVPRARVQILNSRPSALELHQLSKTPGVYFDFARVDATDGVPSLVQCAGRDRVLFGTHTPLLIPESSLIRVGESGRLDEAVIRSVLFDNAQQLVEGTGA